MTQLTNLIMECKDLFFFGQTDMAQIECTENGLGVKFASDYKSYVEQFGAASFAGHELTGICKSERLSVADATLRARAKFPLFPIDAYVVEELLMDDIIVIQYKNGKIYYYGNDEIELECANSLMQYLFPKV